MLRSTGNSGDAHGDDAAAGNDHGAGGSPHHAARNLSRNMSAGSPGGRDDHTARPRTVRVASKAKRAVFTEFSPVAPPLGGAGPQDPRGPRSGIETGAGSEPGANGGGSVERLDQPGSSSTEPQEPSLISNASDVLKEAGPPASPIGLDHTARRVELILQQLDALPTISAVAVRLLELTSDDDSQGKD